MILIIFKRKIVKIVQIGKESFQKIKFFKDYLD